jgi:two-component system, NarL family, sensor histidine kinase UhpB
MTLFRRLFLTYVAVVGLAVAVLVLAPITVSVPTALAELAVILGGFAVTLVLFHAFLRRALAPLETLTKVMHQVDPLAPGQRIDATSGDEEVVALAEAFNEMLDRLEGERRDSGRRALAAQEAERRRIARELHDETAQSLASMLLGLSALQETRTVKAARAQARDLHQVATRALAEVRRLAWGLRPSVLDDLGLATAVERYAEDFGRARGVTVTLETAGLDGARMPVAVETALYRIMQEALSNIARHADAHQVRVRLERRGATVALVVEDDGHGFDLTRPPVASGAARGLGIHSMRERAAVHRGALTINSAPGSGTRVAVEIPLPAAGA